MGEVLARRGPDGFGEWVGDSAALGHRMLYATPESLKEKQPLSDESGEIYLTLDARLDNREELRSLLTPAGYVLRDDTDAEIVLRAYQNWGEDCPARLLGDFAFSIWDRRKRQLFCARDALGLKPFFYHFDGHTFLFASEMQALFRYNGLSRKPNLGLIGLYIAEYFLEREETLYEGILSLPAAHSLIVREGRLEKRQYWDVDPEHSIRYRTDAEYAEHFQELLTDAVRCRLRSNGPVMSSLSGGLDSSTIVCVAHKLIQEGKTPNRGFETFSNVFPGLPCDESDWIEEVIRYTGIKSTLIPYREDSPALALEHTAEYIDAFYEPMTYDAAPFYSEFRGRGITSVLDGIGGDELFTTGLWDLTDLFRGARWLTLWIRLRIAAKMFSEPPSGLFFDFCVRPLVPKPIKTLLRSMVKRRHHPNEELFPPEFLSSHGIYDRIQRGVRVPKFPTVTQQKIYENFFYSWNPLVALHTTELFTSRFSAEMRRPFMDRRLLGFTLAIPHDQRVRGVWTKTLLRQAMAGILPDRILRRPEKTEYSAAMDLQLRGAQAEKVRCLFQDPMLAAIGVVDRNQVRCLLGRYQSGLQEYATGIVELLVNLELWLRAALAQPVRREEIAHAGCSQLSRNRPDPFPQTLFQA